MCKIAQVASPKSSSKIVSFIAIRWLTVKYCVITFSHAESDMSDFTTVLPVIGHQRVKICQLSDLINFVHFSNQFKLTKKNCKPTKLLTFTRNKWCVHSF